MRNQVIERHLKWQHTQIHTEMGKLFTTIFLLLASMGIASAAGGALPLHPESIFGDDSIFFWITDSMVMVWIAAVLIYFFCRAATKKMTMVPSGFQNFSEWLIEALYDFFEKILGAHLVKRTFWFFGSTFLLILTVNYLALIPGVGTVGTQSADGAHFRGFLRGGNADLNMTAAMSLTFAILWFYWALTENSVKQFFSHIFAPKGDFKGAMLAVMVGIFFIVGILEMISIAIRPVALSFRLFGNIYGGEQTLGGLMDLVPYDWMRFLPALPFTFMELLVGLIQALVFTLLSAVFLKLICDHGDHDEEGAH
ncbi:MAG: F-type H+-transporting ATPase subunit a [Rubritalea sp.]|jgi:F-type H+-transporting ATPase subunit a